jgi:ADP-ribose pyrophosphatase YjhB (NUDIX family)
MPTARMTFLTRLILEKEERWLFLEQTKQNGGGYTLVGGRVEASEFAKDALVREAHEEVGIALRKKDIHLVHVVHRRMPRSSEIILIFRARYWVGEPQSQEPQKFSGVAWLPIGELPPRMPEALQYALGRIEKGKMYSEFPKEKKEEKKEKEKIKKKEKTIRPKPRIKLPPPSVPDASDAEIDPTWRWDSASLPQTKDKKTDADDLDKEARWLNEWDDIFGR